MKNLRVQKDGEDVLLWIKAVPGASRNEVAGTVGERLKVRVSAAPEGGKANKAICAVLARHLGVKPRDVSIDSGQSGTEKIVRIAAVTVSDIRWKLC